MINTEVTNRTERLQRILADNRDFLRTLLATTFDGFCVLDSNGRILEVNRVYCEMTGYSEEELTTMHIWEIDDRDDREEVRHRMDQIRSEDSATFSSTLRCRDGGTVDVAVSVSALSKDPISYIAHFRDLRN